MKQSIRSVCISLLAFVLMFLPRKALAACKSGGGAGLQNPICFDTLQGFLTALLGLVVQIAFPVVILFIVYIGFRFVQHSATGNAEELKKDRELIVWAIVGALIVLGAQALSLAIQATVDDLTP